MAKDNFNFGEGTQNSDDIGSFGENLKKMLNIGVRDFADAITRLTDGANQINKTFTQGRQRIVELQQSIADTVPGVNRIGGSLQDVTGTINKIAEASRRNVIANSRDVEKLVAANKVLGEDAEVLTNAFLDVGMSVSQIGPQLEESIKYVQSIGGNASEVVKMMRTNMDQLNRYQFEGGVQGLTKMAAQASMLRFDMNETFRLADKVLSPENAIEVASAFQRLGVSAGNLVDPFQLMNQSINDPSGLQDSLAQVSKQFTYFDEKTKSFKINPQGVMILKEMEAQTGVSAKEMSKMGLAAAELDKRLSAISAAGLKVGSEEDKQFLANIAKMGEGGEYEVQIKDDRGQQQTKKLSEITQQEFDKLIKEQKEGPQTLEELARSQMNLTQLMESDVSAIRNKIVGGVASAAPIGRGMEGLRQITDAIGGALTNVKSGVVGDVRGGTEKFIYGTEKFQKDFMDPNKNKLQVLQEYGKEFGDTLKSMGVNIMDKLKVVSAEAKKNIKGDDIFSRTASGLLSKVPASSTDVNTTTSQNRTQQVQQEVKSIAQNYGATTSSKVEMGGKIVIDVNLNGAQGLTTIQIQELQKILADKFRELNIQNYIVNISTPPDAMGKPK
jgi:uncharacterized phage infection (PIP) family protein YhgE